MKERPSYADLSTLRAEGLSFREIADGYRDVSEATVRRWCQAEGISRQQFAGFCKRFNRLHRDQGGVKALEKLLAERASFVDIGNRFGFSKQRAHEIWTRWYQDEYPRRARC